MRRNYRITADTSTARPSQSNEPSLKDKWPGKSVHRRAAQDKGWQRPTCPTMPWESAARADLTLWLGTASQKWAGHLGHKSSFYCWLRLSWRGAESSDALQKGAEFYRVLGSSPRQQSIIQGCNQNSWSDFKMSMPDLTLNPRARTSGEFGMRRAGMYVFTILPRWFGYNYPLYPVQRGHHKGPAIFEDR